MYGACATCPRHSIPQTGVNTTEDCLCGPGYFLGFNSKAKGGLESYEQGVNGLIYKVHTFDTYDEGILIVADAALGISCAGIITVSPSIWPPEYYPPVATADRCPLPMVMSYPVDIMFNELETSTHMQCVPCPSGTFSAFGGTEDDCISCPSGQYQVGVAQTSCRNCPPGTWSPSGGDSCIPCAQGTYQVGNLCVPCPDGFYSWGIAVTACLPCPNDMWSNNISGGCRLCPRESISRIPGGQESCICSAGLGLVVHSNIPYCVSCEPGTFSPAGAGVCLQCAPGSFSNQLGASTCFQCPTNYSWVSSTGATFCSECKLGETAGSNRSVCVLCPPGKVCPSNTSVVDCPLGSYMTTGGLTSIDQCNKCPANFFCETPTTREPCPVGTYSNTGTVTKHGCICTDQYNCVYFQTITKTMNLDMSRAEFEANYEAFIASLAASLGVSVDSIKIVNIETSPGGLRRVLKGGRGHRGTKLTLEIAQMSLPRSEKLASN